MVDLAKYGLNSRKQTHVDVVVLIIHRNTYGLFYN